ncbi:hypothetical protein COV21_04125 [Candidatus Woesearchaeota archaeon CG10_big_fil_rev_8_21_14_0_10_45_5]|nr:MAG: hypothetical protein COV21_04125 [Candidatus Woesearchaeota archaeon CG10_big_fil_rev_8_21_14_0_10_45_5]
MASPVFEAIATLVGCTIGAGILGIPYVVSRAGFLTGALCIIVLGAMIMMLNLFTGEIVLRTKGEHQLSGYAEKYLGRSAKRVMAAAMIFAIYGAMLAYIMKTGDILAMFLGGSAFVNSILFFSVIALLIYLGPKIIEDSETFMVIFFIAIIALIFAFSLGKISPANLSEFFPSKLLVPYGVVLFALMGMVAIPEIKEEIRGNEKSLKKALIVGSIIPIVVYFIFALSVVGVAGMNTSEASVGSIRAYMGNFPGILAAVFAVLAMSTSFLALGLALQEMYIFDYKKERLFSWFITCFVPLGMFLLIKNFIRVLSITGAVADGTIAILLVLIYIAAKEKGDRKPEYSLRFSKATSVVLLLILTLGLVYEVLSQVGIIKIR